MFLSFAACSVRRIERDSRAVIRLCDACPLQLSAKTGVQPKARNRWQAGSLLWARRPGLPTGALETAGRDGRYEKEGASARTDWIRYFSLTLTISKVAKNGIVSRD